MDFKAQYRDPRWQKKRLEAMNHFGWECQNCGKDESTLNVHHKLYRKGAMIWDYGVDDLEVLCEPCHLLHHKCEKAFREIVSHTGFDTVAGLVAGFCSTDDNVDRDCIDDVRKHSCPSDFAIGFTASLLTYLSAKQVKKVAEFAVSLTKETSEARMRLDHTDAYTWVGD